MGLFSSIFGKKKPQFISPLTGKVMPLENVPDQVFSSKAMGDGFAIDPNAAEVIAPFDAEVVACFPTGHAYGLRSENGVEVLIHIGIDTVELGGAGIRAMVKLGDKVKQGDILAEIDTAKILALGKSTVSPVVFTSGTAINLKKQGVIVQAGDEALVEFE